MGSIDVIVPCYRYGQYLRECVQSILAQPVPVRVLILDDASPDNTPEVGASLAKEDRRVEYRRHATNMRHIATYNEGLEWASADYTLLISADDYLLPNALKRAVDLLDAHPEVAFLFGGGIESYDDGSQREADTPIRERNVPTILSGMEFMRLSGTHNIVCTPTAIVRTSLQKELGGYRRELPHSGDMEMWLRFASGGHVAYIPQAQAIYRRHNSNMSLAYDRLSDLKQRKAALDFFFEHRSHAVPGAASLKRDLDMRLARQAVSAASGYFSAGNLELFEESRRYAVELGGNRIKWTRSWFRLNLKRALGSRLASMLSRVASHRSATRNVY